MEDKTPRSRGKTDPKEFLEKHRARSREYARRKAGKANPPPRKQCQYISPKTKNQCSRSTTTSYCLRHKVHEGNQQPAIVHVTYEDDQKPSAEDEQKIQQAIAKGIEALQDMPVGKVISIPF